MKTYDDYYKQAMAFANEMSDSDDTRVRLLAKCLLIALGATHSAQHTHALFHHLNTFAEEALQSTRSKSN